MSWSLPGAGVPWGPQPPACPGLRGSTTLPAGAFQGAGPRLRRAKCIFGVAVASLIPLARGGCSPLAPRRAARFPRGCRPQPGSSPSPSLLPARIRGDCSNPTPSRLPQAHREAGGLCSGKGEGGCHLGGGSGALLLPPDFYCRAGGPVRKHPTKRSPRTHGEWFDPRNFSVGLRNTGTACPWAAPGRVTLSGGGDLFGCCQSFAPSSQQPAPEPVGPSSLLPGQRPRGFRRGRGFGKPQALPGRCRMPAVGSPAAPARPMGSSTINNRTEILQHPPATGTAPLLSSRPPCSR